MRAVWNFTQAVAGMFAAVAAATVTLLVLGLLFALLGVQV